MTKWHVVKVGAEMLDALHAYGLGILIASATDSPVELNDKGIVYELGSHGLLQVSWIEYCSCRFLETYAHKNRM
jgi:hypothetical protein